MSVTWRAALAVAIIVQVMIVRVAPATGSPLRTPAALNCPAPISHRGEPASAPENTLAGFHAAIGHGSRVLEVDVRFTADLAPVALHDATLDRTTNGKGRLADLSYAQVAMLDAGGGQRVPLLRSVLDAARMGGAAVVLDLKTALDPPELRSLLDAVKAAGMLLRVVAQSRTAVVLTRLRRAEPALATALVGTARRPPTGAFVRRYATHLNIHLRAVSAQRLVDWRRHGLTVWAWTANQTTEWQRLRALGVDGIVTDRTADYRAWCQS